MCLPSFQPIVIHFHVQKVKVRLVATLWTGKPSNLNWILGGGRYYSFLQNLKTGSETNLKVKVKVKFTLEQATKAQSGSRCITVLFLQPRLQMGRVVSATPLPIYPLGKIRYPLCRRLGGPQDQFGRVRKLSLPTGIRSPDRLAVGESLKPI